MTDRRAIRLAVAVPFLVVLATGCGAEPTGHGAPPYQEPSDVPGQGRAGTPPSDGLTIKLPRLAAGERAPARRFVAFEHALAQSFEDGKAVPALKGLSYAALHTQLAKQIRALAKAGTTLPATSTLRVDEIDATSTIATVQACQIDSTGHKLVVALMARAGTTPWRVTTLGRVGHKRC